MTLAFFAGSDGIVMENISCNFLNKVQFNHKTLILIITFILIVITIFSIKTKVINFKTIIYEQTLCNFNCNNHV